MKPILFISDLHLNSNEPHLLQLLLQFLHQEAKSASTLYILGDLFERWLGDDCINEFEIIVAHALNTLAQSGVAIYFIAGNRDFLLGANYAKISGMQCLTEPYVLNLFDYKIILMHGDVLCTLDRPYQCYRSLVRKHFVRWIFYRLPCPIRYGIANWLRNRSKKKSPIPLSQSTRVPQSKLSSHDLTFMGRGMTTLTEGEPRKINQLDVNPAEILPLLQTYHANILVHGHTHQPAIHWLNTPQGMRRRIVLSDWGQQGNFLAVFPSGEWELRYFSLKPNP